MNTYNDIIDSLVLVRRMFGWTQTDLANKLHKRQATISDIENKKIEIGLKELLEIVDNIYQLPVFILTWNRKELMKYILENRSDQLLIKFENDVK